MRHPRGGGGGVTAGPPRAGGWRHPRGGGGGRHHRRRQHASRCDSRHTCSHGTDRAVSGSGTGRCGMSDSRTFWLVVTHIALGAALVVLILGVVTGVLCELVVKL